MEEKAVTVEKRMKRGIRGFMVVCAMLLLLLLVLVS
jgi:Tfp pilus assembly protein PilX